MRTRCAAWILTGVLLAWAGAASGASDVPPAPATPVTVGTPHENEDALPDPMQALNLTDLQRRVLMQPFHCYAFETPAPAPEGAPLAVKVESAAPGGLYRLGPAGDLPVRLAVTVRSVRRAAAVKLRYLAQNFYGSKVAEGTLPPVLPDGAGEARADLVLKELDAFGYYHVLVTATSDEGSVTAFCGIAVVQPFEEGPDPKSPFGLAAPPGKLAATVPEVCRRLGVRRLALDWTGDPAAFDAPRRAGLVVVPIARFDIPQTNPEPTAVTGTLSEVIQRSAEAAPDWQIGRRPEFGAVPGAEAIGSYRGMIGGLITAVRQNSVPARLWVGASPDVLADVLSEGPILAGADGVSLYVDAGAAAPNLRSGAYRRSIDYGAQLARRMGVKRAVVGATGDDPAAHAPQRQAWKLVTRHALALAAGAESVYVSWDRGLPSPPWSAAAYAWMTHLLDGASYQGPAWDDVPLIEAHLFSGPERRVAVVWSWAGANPDEPDQGVLVFDDGLGLEARDVVGQPVGIWKGKRLIVPLGEAPVYLVSGELKANEIRDRLRKATMVGVVPATVHIESIIRGDVPGRASITLWIQSHRPYKQNGIAGLLLPEGWRARQAKQGFPLEAGQAREVTFECDAPAETGAGPYTIEAVISLNEQYARRKQSVWPAQAPERTIEVGYGLKDWQGIAPVVLETRAGDVWAEVRTAWDKEFFYFSAAVRRPRATFRGGRFDFDGDAIQLAWGLAKRADDDFGRPSRDGALPGGAFRDTDHLMALTFTKDGPQVIRLRGPRVALRTHLSGNQDPWYGPVPGAVADIARDEAIGYTLYEAAIPMKELVPLKGERGRTFRFGFRVGNGDDRPLEWSRVAGVPDFLANPASFLPASAADLLPCQTWWGMVGPKPGAPEPAAK